MDILVSSLDSYVRDTLGSPAIGDNGVELEARQLNTIVEAALRFINHENPPTDLFELNVISTKARYVLPIDVTGVLEVQTHFNTPGYRVEDLTVLEVNRRPIVDLDMYMFNRLDFKQLKGSLALETAFEFRYEMESGVRTPVIYIANLTYAGKITLNIVRNTILALESDSYVIKNINEGLSKWLYEYVLAKCTLTVGYVRRKWESELRMDGSNLVSEAKADIARLETELRSKGSILRTPIMG